jgi:hypothetical protein
MAYQIIAYIIFLGLISFITFKVGWIFYKNGEVYLKMLFPKDQHLIQPINRLMLIGYYLLNIGYAAVSLHFWEPVVNLLDVFSAVSTYSAIIILFLAIMHYFNMFWMLIYAKHRNRIKELFNPSGQ